MGLAELSHSGVDYWMSVSLSLLNEWIDLYNRREQERKRLMKQQR